MAHIYIYIIHTIKRRMGAGLYTFKNEMYLVVVRFCVYFFDYSNKKSRANKNKNEIRLLYLGNYTKYIDCHF